MMIDRLAGNAALKDSVRLMLGSSRLTHSVLLVGETGLGAGYAARCVAADYLYPAGGAPAEALLRGECCRAVGKAGDRDSGRIETGVVREAISVTGMGSGGRYLVSQVKAMRTEIFNTSLSAEGRAVLLYHVERMNEESANALLKVMEEPPEGVLFLLTADSLAGVLPTIRSRCISFAVAPVSPEECAQWCIGQGVDKKQARLYSELFDGHIGTVLAAARDDARREQVEKALTLAKAAAAHDSYAAAVLLAGYEKDKAAAAALLLGAGLLCGRSCTGLRLCAGSAAAAVSTLALLAPPWPAPLAVLYKIASCCGVVAVCYGVAGVRSFARLCGWYAALNGLLCGAVVLPGVQANNLSVLLPVRPGQLLLCCAGVYGLLRGLLAVFGRPQRGCFAAVLHIAGATVPVQAYHDTGFTLQDPLAGRRVVLVQYPPLRSRLPAPLRAYLDSWFASGAAPPPGLRVQFVPCAAVTGHCLLPAVPAALCRGQRRVPGLLAAFCAPDAPTGAWTLLLGDDVAEEVGV